MQNPGGHPQDAPHVGGGALLGEPQQVQRGVSGEKSHFQVTIEGECDSGPQCDDFIVYILNLYNAMNCFEYVQ